MRHRGVGTDIDRCAADQRGELRPRERAVEPLDLRARRPRSRRALACHPDRRSPPPQARARQARGEPAPAVVGPALVAKHRRRMDHRVGPRRRGAGTRSRRAARLARRPAQSPSASASRSTSRTRCGVGDDHRPGASARSASAAPARPRLRQSPRCGGPPPRHRTSAGRRSAWRWRDRSGATACARVANDALAPGRSAIVMTFAMSGLPARMPSVPSNTSTSIAASGYARFRLRISGVVSSTSPSRRSATTRMRAGAGVR